MICPACMGALQGILIDEGLLNRMQRSIRARELFDRRDAEALRRHHQN